MWNFQYDLICELYKCYMATAIALKTAREHQCEHTMESTGEPYSYLVTLRLHFKVEIIPAAEQTPTEAPANNITEFNISLRTF